MKFTYDSSLYELADGRAFARFIGVEPFDKRNLKFDPFPNSGPLCRWSFKIIAGENKDKEANVLTGTNPSPKSACRRMIHGITGQVPAEGEEINVDAFRGAYYSISIVDGKLTHNFPPQFLGAEFEKAKSTWVALYPDSEEPPNPVIGESPAF